MENQPNPFVIRAATEADLPAILACYDQPDMDAGQVIDLEEARHIFAQMGRYPNYHVYIAAVDEQVVGTFALAILENLAHHGRPSGLVEDVVVRQDWQGKGIGTRMMEFAMQRCREAGCYKLALSSNLKRTAAHRFYESLGFKKHGYSFLIEL